MGRRNKQYSKSLHQQAYDVLERMIAFGESKKLAKETSGIQDKIYSYSTYHTYKQQVARFIKWLQKTHPEVTTLKAGKRYISDYLQERVDAGQSAWTVSTANSALCKLYQIPPDDPHRFKLPLRRKENIRRSRSLLPSRHFSEQNNAELINFCKCTGVRRAVLERMRGEDYYPRARLEDEVKALENKGKLSPDEITRLNCMREALKMFPDETDFLLHYRDKGGRTRWSPIVAYDPEGKTKEKAIERLKLTGADELVFRRVHCKCDVHQYRSVYARSIYKKYARRYEDLPYDRVHPSGIRYKSQAYYCRTDGMKYDRQCLMLVSKALGHNRVDVVPGHYLRGL